MNTTRCSFVLWLFAHYSLFVPAQSFVNFEFSVPYFLLVFCRYFAILNDVLSDVNVALISSWRDVLQRDSLYITYFLCLRSDMLHGALAKCLFLSLTKLVQMFNIEYLKVSTLNLLPLVSVMIFSECSLASFPLILSTLINSSFPSRMLNSVHSFTRYA